MYSVKNITYTFSIIFIGLISIGNILLLQVIDRRDLEAGLKVQKLLKTQQHIFETHRSIESLNTDIDQLIDIVSEQDSPIDEQLIENLRMRIISNSQNVDTIINRVPDDLSSTAIDIENSYEALSESWMTALEWLDSQPEKGIAEVMLTANPLSSKLSRVQFPELSKAGDELLINEEKRLRIQQVSSRMILHFLTVFTGITVLFVVLLLYRAERREEKIKSELLTMSATVQQSRNGILISNSIGEIRWVNAGFSKMTHFYIDEIIGTQTVQFFSERTSLSFDETRFFLGESSRNVELEFVLKNGKTIWIQLSSTTLLDEQNLNEGSIIILTDISEQKLQAQALKESEIKLKKSQKMEAMGRLAGGVAHDFNNILSIIMISSEFLKESVKDNESVDDVSAIWEATIRGKKLTRQLLAFSTRQPSTPVPMVVEDVLEDMIPLLNRMILESMTLSVNLDDGPSVVLIDPTHFEQIIFNLCSNARDAITDNGYIELSSSPAKLNDTAGITITCSDNGIGIEPEVLEHIFEPFFTTKPDGKGTGLGLATVYGIVQQTGGELSVRSEVGMGTSIIVWLPISDQEEEPTQFVAYRSPASSLAGLTVMIVEDEPQVLENLSKLFSTTGCALRAFSDPEQAWIHAQNVKIDVLLTDIIMPNGSGFELAADIQSLHPQVRILMMTGYLDRTVEPTELSKVKILNKPFSKRELFKEIEELLSI